MATYCYHQQKYYYLLPYEEMSVRLFQLASESLRDVVARRRSDYCPRGAIFVDFDNLLDVKEENYECLWQ